MSKVYFLLRNNQQTGPFSFDELFQQNVTESDLIWVEGHSTKWTHLSETGELTSPAEDKTEKIFKNKKINSRIAYLSPADELEERAAEIKKRAIANANSTFHYNTQPLAFKNKHTLSNGYMQQEANLEIIHHQTKKQNAPSQVLIIALLSFLLSFAWYGNKLSFTGKGDSIDAIATLFVENNEPGHTTVKSKVQADTLRAAIPPQFASLKLGVQPQRQKKPAPKIESMAAVYTEEPVISRTETMPHKEEAALSVEEAVLVETGVQANKEEEPKAVAIERKKTFGQLVKGIFKKKKREQSAEAPEADLSQSLN